MSGHEPTQTWTDELLEKAAQADSLHVEAFMVARCLSRAEMRELLREYRSETGWEPWALGESRGVLGSEFLDWYEWERLA